MSDLIFLSHTTADKQIVDYFAGKLREIFGQDRIFYDTWSISPGESIIGRMNDGIEDCGFFFLFVSKASLNSDMVKREWMSSLNKAIRGELKFIPIMLENVPVPAIFGDIKHLSVYSNGKDMVLRQMIDVITGISENQLQPIKNNLICKVKGCCNSYELAIEATMYTEPKSAYLIVPDCPVDDIAFSIRATMVETNTFSVTNDDGEEKMAYWFMLEFSTVPGFPIRLDIKHKSGKDFQFLVYHQKSEHDFEGIPLTAI